MTNTKTTQTPNITIESMTVPVAVEDRRMVVQTPMPGVRREVPLPTDATSKDKQNMEEARRINDEIEKHSNALVEQFAEAQDGGGPYISVSVCVDGYAMSLSLDTKTLPKGFLDHPDQYVEHIASDVMRMYEARPQPV